MKKRRTGPSRICAALLVFAILCSFVAPQAAAAQDVLSWSRVDNDTVTADLPMENAVETETGQPYDDNENVRVSIFLEETPTISKFEAENIAENQAALAYRTKLEARQTAVAQAISIQALEGRKLDVVWNLTLAANVISANVQYGRIEAIEQVPGVEKVVIETRYDPAVADMDLAVDPNMATSSAMIGSNTAWNAGYTGAGMRIAVIDTGTDTDHQSFSAAGFDYSLELQAAAAGRTVESYDLLDADEIADVLDQLHVHAIRSDLKAEQLYLNTKLPFTFNYIDKDLNVTHDYDSQSEHGSHVAGIATANAYIPNGDGTFSSTLDTVRVQGVAPDAQLITMKVFGRNGGAYASDYLAAVEDAILLKCDTINMSLGSSNPGMVRESEEAYQKILDNLANSGVVVCISAGNAGSWVEYAENGGYLYADDVSMDMVGSPGSFTNSLCVASVDNAGATGAYFTVGNETVVYTESTGYRNAALTTLAGEREYILIDGLGTAEEFSAIADVLQGKIAVCARGSLSFSTKANNAVKNGAIAVIVYNNTSGIFGMDLTGYSYTAPCVSVTKADSNKMRAAAEAVTDTDGNVLYYLGKMTVEKGMGASIYGEEYNSISSFSSWGVPGSLTLKPEISAPGGNIYSVNGKDTSGVAYENMSGTSMAAPQVAGMATLVAQYIEEKNLSMETGLTARQLAQSLLMSTAVPQEEDFGGGESGYYPVLRQGAGLANVGKAVSANSYILMGADATASYADGKVKAELGDDPQRTGVYEFTFSIHNLTAEEETYTLSADLFTQAVFTGDPDGDGVNDTYMDTHTAPLEAQITFDKGSTVTVPAGGSVQVQVTMKLTDAQKAKLNEHYPCGAYVQGFVYAKSDSTAEGVEGTSHSIPVLAFYGSWTDSSMFDRGTRMEYATGEETRLTYLGSTDVNTAVVVYDSDPNSAYYFGGNPLVTDSKYMPMRNAINSENGDQIRQVMFASIRNAGACRVTVENLTQDTTMLEIPGKTVASAFFYIEGNSWQLTANGVSTKFVPTGAKEGDRLELAVTLAPEYYVDDDGNVKWAALGDGASMTIPMVVDNTAPEMTGLVISDDGSTVTVTAKDNQYVAAVALYNASGSKIMAIEGAKQDIQPGEEAVYTLDLSDVRGKSFLLQVFDYAMNTVTYEVKREAGSEDLPEFLAFQTGNKVWVGFGSADSYTAADWSSSRQTFVAAAQVEGLLYAATDRGDLYVTSPDDLAVETLVGNMGRVLTDMAFDRSTGTLYGVSDSRLFRVNKLTGELTELAVIPFETNTLACDGSGTFYSAVHGDSSAVANRGYVYAYTLDALCSDNLCYDFDGDGDQDAADGQALLDYAVGARGSISNPKYADLDGSGSVTSRDAYLFLEKLNSGSLGGSVRQISSKTRNNVQSLVWNPNNGHLYGVLYTVLSTNSHAYFYEIDPETGKDTSLKDFRLETKALVIPALAATGSWADPTDTVSSVQVSSSTLRLLKGSSRTLTASVQPWTASDRSVTWTSADPSVASVDENGTVSGVTPGETVITVTSTLNPSVKASCAVTVEALEVTLKGALQDENGKPMLFTWDLANQNTWTAGPSLETSLASISYDPVTESLFVQDSEMDEWRMHQVDLTTGKDLAVSDRTCAYQFAMSDLAALALHNTAENPAMIGVVHSYIMSPCDPMGNTFNYGWDLSYYLAELSGSASYVAVASLDTGYDNDGALCDLFCALDDKGYVWTFWYDGSDSLSFNLAPSELHLRFPTENNYQYCSMVAGDDGDLYLSYFTGSTNEFYRLTWDREQKLYLADRIGDVGDGVWPAALYAVETNAPAASEAASAGILEQAVTVKSLPMDVSPMSAADSSADGKTVSVTVTAKDAAGVDTAVHNGMADVIYDASALKLEAVNISGDYTASVSQNGTVTFGYVSMNGIDAGDTVAQLTFTVKDGKSDDLQITVTHRETNASASGYTEQLLLGCTHSATELRNAKDATCTEDGYTGDEYCKICGVLVRKGEIIPAAHGETELKNIKEATCTEAGYSGDEVCKLCGKTVKVGKPTAPLGHRWGAWIVTKQPTAEETGEKARTCTRCGETQTETVPATGSDPWVPVQPQTPSGSGTSSKVPEANRFADVSERDWFCDAVRYVYETGLMNGTGATKFSPNATLTRAMVVTILYRMEGEPDVQYGDLFPDVPNNQWYTCGVEWAAKNQVVTGYTTGKFGPEDPVTREQLAAILYRYAKAKGYDVTGSADLGSANVSDYAVAAVAWAVDKDILRTTEGGLRPRESAIRAEVAFAMASFHQRYVK